MTSPWSGAAQSGSREYTPEDVDRVLNALPRGRTDVRCATLRTFAERLEMEGRTVRAILSDFDGDRFLLAYHNDLFWDAETFEEGIGHTKMLRARAMSELRRVGRREVYARTHLQRQQPELMPR